MTFPNDETGEILQQMADAGFDFQGEYVVDFFALFHKEEDADKLAQVFLKRIDQNEPFVKVESRNYDHGGKAADAIELQVSKVMEVTHANIVEFESEYKKLAEKHNGYSDGWGVFMGDENEPEEEDSYVE